MGSPLATPLVGSLYPRCHDDVAFPSLVPKLHLGTQLSAKLYFVGAARQRQCHCPDKCVPKCNLGTRKKKCALQARRLSCWQPCLRRRKVLRLRSRTRCAQDDKPLRCVCPEHLGVAIASCEDGSGFSRNPQPATRNPQPATWRAANATPQPATRPHRRTSPASPNPLCTPNSA